MTMETFAGDAMPLLDDYRGRISSEEELELLDVASAAVAFIYFTGQLYRFEEFRDGGMPPPTRDSSFDRVYEYLERLTANAASHDEKNVLVLVIEALRFIEASNQKQGLNAYLIDLEAETLPPVIGAFKTSEEAETWLDSQAVPPYGARVLIGDEYHSVKRNRARRHPGFLPIPTVEEFIGNHSYEGLPPTTATFETKQEAEAWLANIPEPPRHAFIQTGGDHYLAAYQKNVNHRALYPFSLADEWLRRLREALS